MKLTGHQIQQIRDALLDAYPTADSLRMMLRIELNENLEAIAGGENQRVVVFNLVTWAEQNGRVDALLTGAYNQTPGNPALQHLITEWRAQATTEAEPGLTSPLVTVAKHPGPASIDVFLSYSRKDGSAMQEVLEELREAGLSVWSDEGLEPGTPNWQDAVSEALNQAQVLVVLLSPNAIDSQWVKREISFAQSKGKPVFPLMIAGEESTAVPISLFDAQRVDGRENLQAAVVQGLLPRLRRQPLHAQPAASLAPAAEHKIAVDHGAALSASTEEIGNATINKRHRKPYLGYGVAIIAGALALLLGQRLLLPMLLPSPTPSALNPAPTDPTLTQAATTTTPPPVETLTALPTVEQTDKEATSTPVAEVTAIVALIPTLTPALPATLQPTEVFTPTPVAGATLTNPTDGAVYVYVPSGPFTLGSGADDSLAYDDERPQMTVNVGDFWLMRGEVTNGQYKRCVNDNGACDADGIYRLDDPLYVNHPVTRVTWQQARAYAAWAGGRLPTEAEWEKACRGTDGRVYPWGDSAPTASLANFGNNVADTTRVGRYSVQGDSPYGLVDMAGNTWEWTSSQFQPYPYDAADGREDWQARALRTLRGGSLDTAADTLRCAYRINGGYGDEGRRFFNVGFRVVRP
jgi:formylglycine-generating enzyme required for sulfatase activity